LRFCFDEELEKDPIHMDFNAKEKTSTEMICVTLEIREGALTYRARLTTSSIQRALKIAGGGKPGRKVSLVFPGSQQPVEDKLLQTSNRHRSPR
jgi:hypothetical protein